MIPGESGAIVLASVAEAVVVAASAEVAAVVVDRRGTASTHQAGQRWGQTRSL
jgi:hypothetical protein